MTPAPDLGAVVPATSGSGHPAPARVLSRRTLLAGLPALALGACAAPAPSLRLATGERGGFYAEFGALLAHVAQDSGLPITAQTTGGSRANIHAVATGSADVALTLADLALAARAGSDPFTAALPLSAIGRVYENYLQLAVRAESPYRTAADLRGRPVSLGAAGSGATVTTRRLLAVAGLDLDGRSLDLTAAAAALEQGSVEAFLWSGGVPTPAVASLAARRPIRLLPLGGYVPALRGRYGEGVYTPVDVPVGVYGAAATTSTIGVANLLVATTDLADSAAGALVRVLVDHAPALVPDSALGTQYLDQPALVDTGAVPLHPGAVAAYRELHG